MQNCLKKKIPLKILSWVTLFFFVSQPVLFAAGVIADGSQPELQIREEQGTEIIDIINPNGQGLSHNKYQQFNVGTGGMILNNSVGAYQSQMTGNMVQGNTNLTNGPAKIILNEVVAPNISHLSGKIEVGGTAADVIIANPNGIIGNNFGFINAKQVVMATGAPQIVNGNIQGFSVQGGHIALESGEPVNIQGSKVALLSRTMQINSQIHAGEIRAVSGQYDYKYADGQITAHLPNDSEIEELEPSIEEPRPQVGIDIAALGGMYANRIILIGTEKGVGVNSGGTLSAIGGNVEISNEGKITVKDSEANQIKITAKEADIVNKGLMKGKSISLTGAIFTNEGQDSLVSAQNTISFQIAERIKNQGGTIESNDNLALNTQEIINIQGTIRTDNNMKLEATELINESGLFFAGKNITVEADNIVNQRAEFETIDVTKQFQERTLISSNLPDNWGISMDQMANHSANEKARPIYTTVVEVVETTTTTTEVVADTGAGIFDAGENIKIKGQFLLNDKSNLIAGNSILLEVDTIENRGLELQKVETIEKWQVKKGWGSRSFGSSYGPSSIIITPLEATQTVESIEMVGGRITAPNSVKIIAGKLTQQTIGSQRAAVRDLIRPLEFFDDYNLPNGTEGFRLESGEEKKFLVVREELLGEDEAYLSSDYLLDALQEHANSQEPDIQTGEPPAEPGTVIDEEITIYPKRLGDGFYEQEMIGQQVEKWTGSPLLDNQETDENQYKYLMDNALEVAEAMDLVLGKPLTDEQRKQLDKDIVWMEEKKIGGEIVLIPVVYLVSQMATRESGASIDSIQVNIQTNQLINSGTIHGTQATSIIAPEFLNERGRILGDQVSLVVSGDIVNRSGEIHSTQDLNLQTDGSIINESIPEETMQQVGRYSSNNLSTSVISTDGNLTLKAGENVVLTGSMLLAEKDINIKAGNNIVADTAAMQEALTIYTGHYIRWRGKFSGAHMNAAKSQKNNYAMGSFLGAGGKITLKSENDILLEGTTLQANENILTYSKGNTHIISGQSSFSSPQTGYDLSRIDSAFRNPRDKYDEAFIERWYKNSNHYGVDAEESKLYAGGRIQIFSENDILLQGTQASSLEGVDVIARKDIEILADKDQRWGNSFEQMSKSQNWESYRREYAAPTQLVSDGEVKIVAGYLGDFFIQSEPNSNINPRQSVEYLYRDFENDHVGRLHIQGSAIQSGKKVTLQASGDIVLDAIGLSYEDYYYSKSKKSNGLSKTKTTRISHTKGVTSYGTQIFGDDVEINAGGSVHIEGSTIQAKNDLDITAEKNIDIVAAKNTQDDYHMVKVEKSGFSTSGITGISYGKEKTKNTDWSHQESYTGSSVGSLQGNVTIQAGDDVTVKGSEVYSVTGDIEIEGDNVKIESAAAQGDYHNRFEYSKTGITVSLSNSIIDPLSMAYNYANVAKDANTDELKYTAAAKSALELNKAYEAIPNSANLEAAKSKVTAAENSIKNTKGPVSKEQVAELDKTKQEVAKEEEKNKKAEVSLNITVGSQKYSSKQDTYTTTNYGSSVSAGGDILIKARGDEASGKEGDITVQGSHLVGENITLEAKDDIHIVAATDSQTTKGSNTSSGWSVGVDINLTTGDFQGVGVSVSGGKGSNRGDGTFHNESIIEAKDTLIIQSGADTNIIGSVVKGDTVKAEIGGDLNIQTLQDTDNYHEKQTNWGISVNSTGAVSGSYSQQKIDSEYKSAQEQAGIYAGEGGFDIEVGGNTDLKGAVISSEADAEKNKISTETLTWSHLKNEAEWESKTTGISGSSKTPDDDKRDQGLTPIFGGSKGDDDSTTKSGISEGAIEIRDEEHQKQDVEDLNRDTTHTNNPLDKIFDKDKILEKEQAAALFGEIGFEAIGKLIDAKEQSKEWEPGDPRAIALHALVGGIMAEINGGGFGEGLTTAAINKLIISKLADSGLVDGAELRWISAALGYALNGAEGAALADSATRNNELRSEVIEKAKEFGVDSDVLDRLENQGYTLSEKAHVILDTIGMLPVVGEGADGLNAAIYYFEGNYSDATLSAMGIVPVFGNFLVGGKYTNKAYKVVDEAKLLSNSDKLVQVYPGIKYAPKYPEGFSTVQNGTRRININNQDLYDVLRKVEPGEWKKVYRDGYDASGQRISVHYFEHSKTGKVFDVKTKEGWSNI